MGKYFTIKELTHSDTAERRKLPNDPPPSAVKNLEVLIANYLDPFREYWGGPIRVTSGYRSYATNRAVGGCVTSGHTIGTACDLQPVRGSVNDLYKALLEWLKDKEFDEAIIERSGHTQWVHFSWKSTSYKQRKKICSIVV